MQSENFTKVLVAEALQKFNVTGSEIMHNSYQLPYTHAFVYKHKTGEVLLLPSGLSARDTCIIFKDEQSFNYYSKQDSFPIENNPKSLEEFFQPEIKSLPDKLTDMRLFLAGFFKMDTADLEVEKILLQAQSHIERHEGDLKVYLYASLLLAEEIRKNVKGKWIILKKFGKINPYWIPAIVRKNGDIILVLERVKFYWHHQGVQLAKYLDSDLSKVSHMKVGTKRFKYAFSDFRKF